MDDLPKQNTGLIEGRRDSDFIAGTLPYEVRNPTGDWRPFLVKEEKQYSDNTDTMGCVSFSANNTLEIQHKQQTGVELNFSDRFLAKMSNTTPQGNWLYIVADTLRNIGIVFEDEWPTPPNYNWQTYYADIPQAIKDKAQKYGVTYEWVEPVKDQLLKHLKHAPLQITIPEPYPNHAVVLVHIEGDTAYYFDTYPNYLKTISVSKISSALKLIANFNMYITKKVKVVSSTGTAFGVLVQTPNAIVITLAEDEAEWRSYSKSDSYRVHTVNSDNSTDWTIDSTINL